MQHISLGFEHNRAGRQILGDTDADARVPGFDAQAESRFEISGLRRTDLLDRIPVLAERLRLPRGEEGKVGLVVGVNAGHDFDVRTILIREVAIPGVTELMVAPGPLLLAGSNVVIGDMHHASVRRMVVPAEEILLRANDHVAGGHGNVRIPAQIVRRVRCRREQTGVASLPQARPWLRARRSRRRSRGRRTAGSGSLPAWRDRPHTAHLAERTTDSAHARGSQRLPTTETSG